MPDRDLGVAHTDAPTAQAGIDINDATQAEYDRMRTLAAEIIAKV